MLIRGTYLSCPPPPGVEVRVDTDSLVFIGKMPFWCELHHRCKFRFPKQLLDALQDITMEDLKLFATNFNCILFEFASTWEAVDQSV